MPCSGWTCTCTVASRATSRRRPSAWRSWTHAAWCRTRPYRPEALLGFLAHCRDEARSRLAEPSPEDLARPCRFPWGEIPYAELLLYSMRHVQEHAAQLALHLGRNTGQPPRWVKWAREGP
jgi:hypothetical protein